MNLQIKRWHKPQHLQLLPLS